MPSPSLARLYPLGKHVSVLCVCESVPVLWMYLNKYFYFCLGLRCFAWAFSSCRKQGLLLVAVHRLLTVAASLVEHGLSSVRARLLRLWGSRAQARWLWHLVSVALRHVGSSRVRDPTCVSCTGRRILYHLGSPTEKRVGWDFTHAHKRTLTPTSILPVST